MLDGSHYPSRGNRGAKRKWPWDETEVGEHFIVENRKVNSFTGTLAYANASRWPKRFVSRTVGDNLEVRRVK